MDVTNSHVALGDLYLNTTTYRHAVPRLNRCVRLAGVVPVGFSNLTSRTEGGLGDLGADVEWTLWVSTSRGLVVGLRTTWSTATMTGEVGVRLRRQIPAYVRPSAGLGRQHDEPYDWGVAAGVRLAP